MLFSFVNVGFVDLSGNSDKMKVEKSASLGGKMKIICLIEDYQKDLRFGSEHGVSFYLETSNHKLLFDVGQSSLFLSNALKMNVDISKVDTLVISHGHYDHGGGLEDFLRVNKHAKVYIQEEALEDFYSMRKENEYTYIGLDQKLFSSDRLIKIKGNTVIDDEITIISKIKKKEFFPTSNQTMYKKVKGNYLLDDFSHEQSLLVKDKDAYVLLVGCSHMGIINIINQVEKKIEPNRLTAVIGGFHFKSRSEEHQESEKTIMEIASFMKDKKIEMYYTGHCTGKNAYNIMKNILKDRLNSFYPGWQIDINNKKMNKF